MSSASALVRSRCVPQGPTLDLADSRAHALSDSYLDVGDALVSGSLTAVGFVHPAVGGRTAAVAIVSGPSNPGMRIVDLGPTLGDAPPPRLALRGDEWLAVAYGLPTEEIRRELDVYRIPPGGEASVRQLRVFEQRDDSFGFDVASLGWTTLVVWDEVAEGPRGVVRAAAFAPGDAAATPVALSPPDADVELPRVVVTPPGFTVLWVARQPDAKPALGDRSVAESPGETAAFGWLESVAVDEHGARTGPSHRLTSPRGHVSAYDVQRLPGEGPLLVVARDDGETVDGSGGLLLRVVIDGERIAPPLAFATDGLGRGGPELVDGPSIWLSWVGPEESLRLMPLDRTGSPLGPPSVEDAMNDARPLVALSGALEALPDAARQTARLLVASPDGAPGGLRAFACVP
ncbi:MAG: hypothetical protein ABSC94_07720 [Polyangiaceae bacterium]